jgi:geranylgeranyl diphosphate synthase type II
VTLDDYLARCRSAVDAELERRVPAASETPGTIHQAMRYSLFAGGKRIRPVLCMAAAEAVTGVSSGAEAPSCALELVHTYSLIHDDLPSLDNDDYRRGRLTCHKVYGEAMAILAGDALLTDAFALLAREPVSDPAGGIGHGELARRKLQAIRIIADAAGSEGMVGGQALDLRAAAPGAAPLDETRLREMHARKTGALLRASALAGAAMAGASLDLLDAVGDYGKHIGLAFQIVDDILDVEEASTVLG